MQPRGGAPGGEEVGGVALRRRVGPGEQARGVAEPRECASDARHVPPPWLVVIGPEDHRAIVQGGECGVAGRAVCPGDGPHGQPPGIGERLRGFLPLADDDECGGALRQALAPVERQGFYFPPPQTGGRAVRLIPRHRLVAARVLAATVDRDGNAVALTDPIIDCAYGPPRGCCPVEQRESRAVVWPGIVPDAAGTVAGELVDITSGLGFDRERPGLFIATTTRECAVRGTEAVTAATGTTRQCVPAVADRAWTLLVIPLCAINRFSAHSSLSSLLATRAIRAES